jgi:nitrogen fixation protein NifT
MKVMIRRTSPTALSAYVAKKDLEEPIVSQEREELWGGTIALANGWRLELPPMPAGTSLPITVEARRLSDGE